MTARARSSRGSAFSYAVASAISCARRALSRSTPPPRATAPALAFRAGDGSDPADLVEDRETRERARVALEKAWHALTAREALVLDLALRETLAQRRIASLLRISEPRVSRLLHAATGKLEDAVARALRENDARLALADARDLLGVLLEKHRQSGATPPDLPAADPEIRHERPTAT